MLRSWGGNLVTATRNHAHCLHHAWRQPRSGVHPESERGADRRTFMPWPSWACLIGDGLAAQSWSRALGVSLKKLRSHRFPAAQSGHRLRNCRARKLPRCCKRWSCCQCSSAVYYWCGKISEAFLSLPSERERGCRKVGVHSDPAVEGGVLFIGLRAGGPVPAEAALPAGHAMSKQEIRDEMKEVEGDPLMKQRIRRLRRDTARAA